MLSRRSIPLASLLATICLCRLCLAVDEAQIKPLLTRAVIGSETTLAEIQIYTERRVPRLPHVDSAEAWERFATSTRQDVLSGVVFRGEAADWRRQPTRIEWLDVIDTDSDYTIKKLRYEAVPGMWIPALLYEPGDLSGKVPVIMNVNGHDRANGKAAEQKQIRCINQARRGMIALNVEWLGMGQLHSPGMSHYAMNQLDLCGTGGLAPFYLSMKRGLDVLLQHPNADSTRVGVAGLSGGGWQTIFVSSLDTRVTLANPVAGYSSFITRARHLKDLGDSEQTPSDLAVHADYTHLTAMLAPRAALLTYNKTDDCCFESTYALQPLIDSARPIYRLFGRPTRLRSHVNIDPGTHNFGKENREALYAMLGEHFYSGDQSFRVDEIDCHDQLRTKDELTVAVPEDNATFNSIALELSSSLPNNPKLPSTEGEAEEWRTSKTQVLRRLVQLDRDDYSVAAELQDSFSRHSLRVSYLRFKIGGDWTVPATEISPPNAKSTSIIISDQGRMSMSPTVAQLINDGHRVLAVDPFFFGESSVSQKDFLFAFMIATVGRRPLGVQAGQLAAVARWCRANDDGKVRLIAEGPRTSLAALVAAALSPDTISSVELYGSLGSLKEPIENNQLANQTPELFCFGLLKEFDIVQLAALSAPRGVVFRNANERSKSELQPLRAWYRRLGVDHDPLTPAD